MDTMTITVNPAEPETETNYHSITKAVNSIALFEETAIIKISPGIYEERVEIWRSDVFLEGTGPTPSDTVITSSFGAFDLMEDGSKRGTFRSYTMLLNGDRLHLKNLTVANEAGDPVKRGQAIALYAEGDNILVEHCRLTGRQDTLFTGPLPPKEIQPGGFTGPTQNAPRKHGHHLYKDCYICGDVDFIFGSAEADFICCTIESVPHRSAKSDTDMIQGYVCAPSTPKGQLRGYTFTGCNLIGPDLRPATVYLSRPWRDYARAHFKDCSFGDHIHPDLFHDWNKSAARENAVFTVADCTYNGENISFRAFSDEPV